MPSLSHFVRLARPADLLDHVRRLEGDFEGSINMEPSTIAEKLSKSCTRAQRDRLVAELDRVGGMADEIGQAAMLALPDWRAELMKIESAFARAHWLFLQSQDAFRHAEEIRYVDENQNSRRMWTGFVAPKDIEIDMGPITIDAMSRAVSEAFGVGRFHIEPIERLQPHDPVGRHIQLTVYSEDLPVDELEFAEEGLKSRPRRPVRETAIVYDGQNGAIEVVSKRQEMRHTFATLFAEHCLGIILSGEKLPLLMLDLMPLIDPHPFPTEPQDGIAKVKLTTLTLSPSDERLTQQFQVTFDDPATLHELVSDQYGDRNPLEGDLYPWRASIEVQFEPAIGSRRRKKIRVDLTKPNRCNLRGKTDRERLILDRYLRDWGIRLPDAA